jgi:hypothetical protein
METINSQDLIDKVICGQSHCIAASELCIAKVSKKPTMGCTFF